MAVQIINTNNNSNENGKHLFDILILFLYGISTERTIFKEILCYIFDCNISALPPRKF